MTLPRLILLFALCVAGPLASAQLKVIPKERLDSVASPPLAPDAASVIFDKIMIDAGTMTEKAAPETFEYVFENRGNAAVTITRLVSTCSCTAARYDRRMVQPGEKGKILLRYDPRGHVGRFERRVFVYTDENRQPTAVLRLKVNVISE